MTTRSRRRSAQQWQSADNKLAIATIMLMVFLLVAGLTAWLVNESSNTAGVAPAAAHSQSK